MSSFLRGGSTNWGRKQGQESWGLSRLSNLAQLVESHLSLVASSAPSTLPYRLAQHSEIKGQPCPPDDILQTPLSGCAGTVVRTLPRKCFLPGGLCPACLVLGTDDGEGQPWPPAIPAAQTPPSCTETRPHSPPASDPFPDSLSPCNCVSLRPPTPAFREVVPKALGR